MSTIIFVATNTVLYGTGFGSSSNVIPMFQFIYKLNML